MPAPSFELFFNLRAPRIYYEVHKIISFSLQSKPSAHPQQQQHPLTHSLTRIHRERERERMSERAHI